MDNCAHVYHLLVYFNIYIKNSALLMYNIASGHYNFPYYMVSYVNTFTGDLPVPSPRKPVSSRLSEGNPITMLADWPVMLLYMLAEYILHQCD